MKELTEKLAKHDPNFRKGKNNVFELLTRDEADKETQALQDELERYKKLVTEKDRALMDRDKEIESLRDDRKQPLTLFLRCRDLRTLCAAFSRTGAEN